MSQCAWARRLTAANQADRQTSSDSPPSDRNSRGPCALSGPLEGVISTTE
jgi:hypothetical protein